MKKLRLGALLLALFLFVGCSSLNVNSFDEIPVGDTGFSVFWPSSRFNLISRSHEFKEYGYMEYYGEGATDGYEINITLQYMDMPDNFPWDTIDKEGFLFEISKLHEPFEFTFGDSYTYRGARAAVVNFKEYNKDDILLLVSDVVIDTPKSYYFLSSFIFWKDGDVGYVNLSYDWEYGKEAMRIEERILEQLIGNVPDDYFWYNEVF